MKLLHQIANEPPTRPRQLNPAVPRDLETILLKAMAVEPAERYVTAQDLADDIERYLSDKPVLATRPSMVQRSAKWSRRHRHLVASLFAILILTVLGLSISAVMINQQRDVAEAAATNAAEQHQRAERILEKAQTTIDSFTSLAAGLAGRPQMEQFRRELLVRVLQFYQGFLEDTHNEPVFRVETARVHERIADIYYSLGERGKAVPHRKASQRVLKALCDEFPRETKYREHLAEIYAKIGYELLRIRRGDGGGLEVLHEAEDYMDASLGEWKHLAAANPLKPEYRKQVAAWHFNWLDHPRNKADPIAGVRKVREGLKLLDDLEQEFPAYPKDKALRGEAHYLLGMYLDYLRQYDQAEIHYRSALETGMDKIRNWRLARLLLMRGMPAEAEELVTPGIEDYRRRVEAHPGTMSNEKRNLMHLVWVLHRILLGAERWVEAEAAVREVIRIRADRSNLHPNNRMYEFQVAQAYYGLGNVLFAAGNPTEAIEHYQRAIPMLEDVAVHDPTCHEHQSHVAYFLSMCPEKQFRNPQLAVSAASRAVALAPAYSKYQIVLAIAQFGAGDYAAVVETLERVEVQSDAPLPAHCQVGTRDGILPTG